MFKNFTLERVNPKLLNESRETPPHTEVTYSGKSGERDHSKKSIKVVHFPSGGTIYRHIWFLLLLPPYLIGNQGLIIFLLVDFSFHAFSFITISITLVRIPDSLELLKPNWNIIPSNMHPTPSLIFIKHRYHDGIYILKLLMVPYFVIQQIRSR